MYVEFDFTVIVTNLCTSTVLTHTAVSTVAYTLRDPSQDITLSFFSTNTAFYCGSWVFSAKLTSGSALDSSVFTVTATSPYKIAVYSTTPAKAQTYSIRIKFY